jgi:hypothetical protein
VFVLQENVSLSARKGNAASQASPIKEEGMPDNPDVRLRAVTDDRCEPHRITATEEVAGQQRVIILEQDENGQYREVGFRFERPASRPIAG